MRIQGTIFLCPFSLWPAQTISRNQKALFKEQPHMSLNRKCGMEGGTGQQSSPRFAGFQEAGLGRGPRHPWYFAGPWQRGEALRPDRQSGSINSFTWQQLRWAQGTCLGHTGDRHPPGLFHPLPAPEDSLVCLSERVLVSFLHSPSLRAVVFPAPGPLCPPVPRPVRATNPLGPPGGRGW